MVNSLLQVGMKAISSGKLPIGAKMSRILDSGTVVDVVNKGKGVLQKIVKKQNGDVYTSIFKDGKLQQMTARNSRGGYTIKPYIDETFDFLGVSSEKMQKIRGWVKGPTPLSFDLHKYVNGPQAGQYDIALDKQYSAFNEAGAKKLYDYLVKQNPNETLKDLHKYTL